MFVRKYFTISASKINRKVNIQTVKKLTWKPEPINIVIRNDGEENKTKEKDSESEHKMIMKRIEKHFVYQNSNIAKMILKLTL